MPNNRGGVPMYNENPQYNATVSAQVPQGSPAMFGTQVAKEMAGMGDAIGKWGTNLVDYALKRQEQDDDNYIMRRENDMRKALNDLLYNPQSGLANQKGHNADGVTLTFDDAADKLTQQFMTDVNNPVLQNKFQARVAQWLPSYRKGIAVHEGNEVFSAHKLDIDTSIQDKIDDALRAPNASSVGVLYASLGQNVADLMNILGMSREAAAEYVQEKYSGGVLQVAEAISGRGDTQGLLDLLKETDGKVSASTQSKLIAMTGKVQSQMKGIEIAKQYRNNPKYLNPDGTFNAVLALQDYEKEHGKGATRTERVFVGGGSINTIDGLMAAIGGQESGGNYDAQNGRTGAYGKYQIMPGNWPSWSEEAGLGSNAERTPENQEKVARFKLNQYLQQYGAEGAMVAWYSGPANAERWVRGETTDVYGRSWDAKNGNGDEPSIREYVQQVSSRGGKGGVSTDTLDSGINASGVKIEGTRPETIGMINRAAQIYKQLFGRDDFWLSSTVTGHNDGTPHALGYKADVGGSALEESYENRVKFQQALQAEGIGANNEYDQPSEASTGGHFDLDVRGKNWQTGENFGGFKVNGAGHWEERTVSAYNEQEYNEGLKWLKEQGEYSKAEHDQVFSNALNDALTKVKSLRMPSEVDAVAHSYGLSETDAKRLYNVLLGARVDLADENQRYSDNQKERSLRKQAEEDAADAFYAWLNDNPNASDTEIRTKAADYGVSARFMHSLNSMIDKTTKNGGNSWFKNPHNKSIFNNAIRQNELKGEQISNAMDIVTQKEAEKGSPLTADEITTIVNKASAETVIYKGKWYEKDITGRAVDYSGGVIGKDKNGIDVTSDGGLNYVSAVDESDFEE